MAGADRCDNCGRTVDGPAQGFCPECGQRTPARRIDWAFLIQELEQGVFNMDRGILYTLRMLMLRPGRLIRDYIAGRRAGHVKPLWLLMVTGASVIFLTRYVGDAGAVADFSAGYTAGVEAHGSDDAAARASAAFERVGEWIGRHFTVTTLLLLPLEAALFRLVFWRTKGLNYPEWLTIIAFLTAQTFVVWACFTVIGAWFPAAHGLMLWVALAYMLASLVSAFSDEPRWRILLRGIVALVVYLAASMAVFFAAVMVSVLVTGR